MSASTCRFACANKWQSYTCQTTATTEGRFADARHIVRDYYRRYGFIFYRCDSTRSCRRCKNEILHFCHDFPFCRNCSVLFCGFKRMLLFVGQFFFALEPANKYVTYVCRCTYRCVTANFVGNFCLYRACHADILLKRNCRPLCRKRSVLFCGFKRIFLFIGQFFFAFKPTNKRITFVCHCFYCYVFADFASVLNCNRACRTNILFKRNFRPFCRKCSALFCGFKRILLFVGQFSFAFKPTNKRVTFVCRCFYGYVFADFASVLNHNNACRADILLKRNRRPFCRKSSVGIFYCKNVLNIIG